MYPSYLFSSFYLSLSSLLFTTDKTQKDITEITEKFPVTFSRIRHAVLNEYF